MMHSIILARTETYRALFIAVGIYQSDPATENFGVSAKSLLLFGIFPRLIRQQLPWKPKLMAFKFIYVNS
ncbi:hypothetical protein GL2_22360 [Microbulbifer sp. GL-2]|nr:hypothetical protein GL2_22360 [Microbulbifer sp. GL-2]